MALSKIPGIDSSVATLKKLKNLDRPTKNPRKPKVTFLCNWQKFLGKIQLFPKKPNSSRKNVFFLPKTTDKNY